MPLPAPSSELDFRPGLILGETARDRSVDVDVRTDVAAFVRVRWLPEPLDLEADDVEGLEVADLPGSVDAVELPFQLIHHEMTEWDEEVFAKEFRTQRPSLVRLYFANGGVTVHLVDLTFSVPPFDPSELEEDEDPELIAEQRLEVAFLRFYSWVFERLDDYGAGSISQICLPELWLRQVHLLPTVWAMAATFARRTGNRFIIADSCPPFGLLQDAERTRALAEGYELTPEELTAEALVPWYREEKWGGREDIVTEVALTIDALEETRNNLRRSQLTLSCLAVYWPWVRNQRGMNLPPSGAVAGVYARSDDENGPVGVMKPPANETVKGIQDIALHVDERPRNLLQRAGINILQARSGRGIIIWGARTLSVDDLWRFVNVRRLIGYIGKQLDMDNQWAIFENNTQSLRERVERDTKYFLHDLFELGALRGDTADEAYVVRCTGENNPVASREAGILVVDVWVNPVQTNEFVHLQLKYGDASVQ
jgi:hypothetical protein